MLLMDEKEKKMNKKRLFHLNINSERKIVEEVKTLGSIFFLKFTTL